MKRPGFAYLRYHADERRVEVVQTSYVSNKQKPKGQPYAKPHGEILCEIAAEFSKYMLRKETQVFVREAVFAHYNNETKAMSKVSGVTDYILWDIMRTTFQEIAPTSIKKYIAGNGYASKDEVAEGLHYYVGDYKTVTDDESDAIAAGISWLVKFGYLEQSTFNPRGHVDDVIYLR